MTPAARRAHRRVSGSAFLDVDRFKAVNDSLGHAMGDRLLVELSRRLRTCFRDATRWRAWVATSSSSSCRACLAARMPRPDQKLLDAIRAPMQLGQQELIVTASIGVSHLHPFDGQERDPLLRHADAALYRAKARGRNRFELYRHGHRRPGRRPGPAGRGLRRALRPGRAVAWSISRRSACGPGASSGSRR